MKAERRSALGGWKHRKSQSDVGRKGSSQAVEPRGVKAWEDQKSPNSHSYANFVEYRSCDHLFGRVSILNEHDRTHKKKYSSTPDGYNLNQYDSNRCHQHTSTMAPSGPEYKSVNFYQADITARSTTLLLQNTRGKDFLSLILKLLLVGTQLESLPCGNMPTICDPSVIPLALVKPPYWAWPD
ncbi:unnamed protein product [Ceratitis capitata]|uniref:(Mediterranean fruit fly) hypothetical protein n=1 Tax=Ceratitis capitata TaxID=7213 RepID=A0A811V4E3_CERCA|nr:unnamed protein product [Ceratitis capitata]